MATANDLYEERMERILAAVRLEKPDRVPVVPMGDSFCARHQGVKLSEFCIDPELSSRVILKCFLELGEVDGVQVPNFYVHALSSIWLSRLKIPGRDLPEDELWQVDEAELMTESDYDAIINDGFRSFLERFYAEKLDNLGEKLPVMYMSLPAAMQAFREQGIVPFSPAVTTIPYEVFCGARSMHQFLRDLYRIPDKVQAAMDVAIADLIEDARMMCRMVKPIAAWVGGWRAASEFISPRHWQRFVLPYFKQMVEAVVEEGVIAVLHFDSDWTRDLEHLRELPARRIVFSPDGSTDIFKAKRILGDHACIMGDVPASLLSLGTVDKVEEYCRRLIAEIGPAGFILAQGCDIPPNAKPENVAAMIASVKKFGA